MNQTFRTQLPPYPFPFQINHQHRLMLLGSCFTEHMGARLEAGKFESMMNPYGIVYNPISMAMCLERLVEATHEFNSETLFEHAGLWHSWEHHGRFSDPDKNKALENINTSYKAAVEFLRKADFLFLTFGTADVFELSEKNQVVANNHKMPATYFASRRLSVPEIVERTINVLEKIQSINPALRTILTVSPVRHLRAGLMANQRSKATLILACAEINARLPKISTYFPAYELVLDDLRDYRFFAEDMTHPSGPAIEYVWQYFAASFFSEKTQQLYDRVLKIQKAMQHRPFHPGTPEHRVFAQAQLAAIEMLQEEIPAQFFEAERAYFQKF